MEFTGWERKYAKAHLEDCCLNVLSARFFLSVAEFYAAASINSVLVNCNYNICRMFIQILLMKIAVLAIFFA